MGEPMRIAIRVKPGASRTHVGGLHADRLVVAVQARAVDGKATEAALQALAEALGLRRREVYLISGHTSRDKLVAAEPAPAKLPAAERELARLRAL